MTLIRRLGNALDSPVRHRVLDHGRRLLIQDVTFVTRQNTQNMKTLSFVLFALDPKK